MPWPVGTLPFLGQLLHGALLPFTPPLLVPLLFYVPGRRAATCSCCAWGSPVASVSARGRSSALCATARGRFAARSPPALGRSSALCVVIRCRCGASCSAAPEALLSLIPGLVGALVRPIVSASLSWWFSHGLVGACSPFVCMRVGAPLPVVVPLLFAPVLRALSREVVVPPPAQLDLGLPCCFLLGVRALTCHLCDAPRPLCCLSLRCSSSLTSYTRCLSRLLWRLFLCWSLGSAFAHARARGRSSAPCVTARRCFAAHCAAATCGSPAPCAVFLVPCFTTCSATCGAALWLMPRLVGAPPPRARLPMGAYLPFALSSWTAPLLRELSLEEPPSAPFLVGLLYLVRLRLWALLCLRCDVPWALCRLSLHRFRPLSCPLR